MVMPAYQPAPSVFEQMSDDSLVELADVVSVPGSPPAVHSSGSQPSVFDDSASFVELADANISGLGYSPSVHALAVLEETSISDEQPMDVATYDDDHDVGLTFQLVRDATTNKLQQLTD